MVNTEKESKDIRASIAEFTFGSPDAAVFMEGDVVYWKATGRRAIRTIIDFGILDKSPGIREKRGRTLG